MQCNLEMRIQDDVHRRGPSTFSPLLAATYQERLKRRIDMVCKSPLLKQPKQLHESAYPQKQQSGHCFHHRSMWGAAATDMQSRAPLFCTVRSYQRCYF
jgi:hypothetical protein